jgi:hypothetical protein
MNLADLIDYTGNLMDYDPSNETYRAQLITLLNKAQVRVLADRPWTFAQRQRELSVWTDTTLSLGVSNGSATVSGTFTVSSSAVKPGSSLDGALLVWTDSAGEQHRHIISWVKATNSLFLDRDYAGVSGTYVADVLRRDIYLPSDAVTVQSVLDPSVGVPRALDYIGKWEKELYSLDASSLGATSSYCNAQGKRTPAPQTPSGVSTVAASSQGVRTIHVWMVNVLGPYATNVPMYSADVSDGFESGFSSEKVYELTDTETLRFTPETIPSRTGLYRRYYFTCPEAGIFAPVRVRSAGGQGVAAAGVDTVNPEGSVVLAPDLSLATLQSQSFSSTSVRYVWSNSGAYQSILAYPHPTTDQKLTVRTVIAPERLQEDRDVPLIPEAHSEIVALAALETLAAKTATPALSEMYARKTALKLMGLEQAYLERVPRRLVRGSTTAMFHSPTYLSVKLVP